MKHHQISVLGAGSWGTALAILLAENGNRTCLWGHESAHIRKLKKANCNVDYLPDVKFPAALTLTHSLTEALHSEDILLVIPSHAFQSVLRDCQPLLTSKHRICWATKGLEAGTGEFLHKVVSRELGDRPTAVISGPNFAKEIAAGMPGAVTVASEFPAFADDVAKWLCNDHFRAYTSKDIIGVELGGCVKNVMAIAAGISDGLHFGSNARAALITRGLAEMVRLGECLGGHRETFMGLSGIGDLVLTCTDDQSRNRRLGLKIAQGLSLKVALDEIGQAVEGERAVVALLHLAQQHQVEMPITEQVNQVLHYAREPSVAVKSLLTREHKPEVI